VRHLAGFGKSAIWALSIHSRRASWFFCFGKATRFVRFIPDADKRYTAGFRFRLCHQSFDSEGQPAGTGCGAGAAARKRWSGWRRNPRGDLSRCRRFFPPRKSTGGPAYELARKNQVVELKAVPVGDLRIPPDRNEGADRGAFRLSCSSGTYIRSLGARTGDRSWAVARIWRKSAARRWGEFSLEQAIGLEETVAVKEGWKNSRSLPDPAGAPAAEFFRETNVAARTGKEDSPWGEIQRDAFAVEAWRVEAAAGRHDAFWIPKKFSRRGYACSARK